MRGAPQVGFSAAKVPLNHGLWLDEEKHIGPSGPHPAQGDPEQAVSGRDPPTPTAAGEDSELLPQGEVLDQKVGTRTKRGGNNAEEQ
jgi:hypothetical protein